MNLMTSILRKRRFGVIFMEIRLKHLTSISNTYPIGDGDHGQIKPEQYLDCGVPYIRVQNLSFCDKINFDGMVYISNEVNLQNAKSILHPGDILVAKTGATIGKAGVLPESIPVANTTSSVGKITIDSKRAVPKYIYYCVASDPLQKTMWEIASTKSAQPGFNIEDIKEFRVWLPDISTQNRIVTFLDKKINAIDGLIVKEEESIKQLTEYRFIQITKFVLEGLNKTPLKETDVKWMPKIPSHWSYTKIGSNCYLKGRIGWQGLTADEYQEVGPYLITGTDFDNGGINWNTCVHITEKRYVEASHIRIRNGDVLITKDGTVGKVAIVENMPGKASLNSGVMLMRNVKGQYENKYLYYVLSSNVFWDWFYREKKENSTIVHLYQEQFEKFSFPLPPKNEQLEIAEYLDKKCDAIDKLVKLKEEKIEKLKEYKKSLIYECVTGRRAF